MLADWLGHGNGPQDVYLAGLVASNAVACQKLLAIDAEPAEHGVSAVASNAFVQAMAVACRERFGTDYGLAVGPMPAADAAGGDPLKVPVALATNDGVQVLAVTVGLHPALRHIYCAKHALNLLRLAAGTG
jgi:nicotinamide mononucleotide (NMN) deamidase PncC